MVGKLVLVDYRFHRDDRFEDRAINYFGPLLGSFDTSLPCGLEKSVEISGRIVVFQSSERKSFGDTHLSFNRHFICIRFSVPFAFLFR